MARGVRKPTALKVLHGDDKKDPARINRDEPAGAFREPTKPDGFTDRASAIYDQTVIDLRGMRLLHGVDEALIMQYAIAAERAEKAGFELGRGPLTVRNPVNGAPMSNPLIKDWIALKGAWLRLAMQLGLTPASRSTIRVKNAQADPTPSQSASPERLFG